MKIVPLSFSDLHTALFISFILSVILSMMKLSNASNIYIPIPSRLASLFHFCLWWFYLIFQYLLSFDDYLRYRPSLKILRWYVKYILSNIPPPYLDFFVSFWWTCFFLYYLFSYFYICLSAMQFSLSNSYLACLHLSSVSRIYAGCWHCFFSTFLLVEIFICHPSIFFKKERKRRKKTIFKNNTRIEKK